MNHAIMYPFDLNIRILWVHCCNILLFTCNTKLCGKNDCPIEEAISILQRTAAWTRRIDLIFSDYFALTINVILKLV